MNKSDKLLSDIVAFRTYAKHLPTQSRRETLEETINRNMAMHLDKFPKLSKEIVKAYEKVHNLEVMPSMRSMQFAGAAVEKNPIRGYNCSFRHINEVRAFGEILFLLLSGTGVGFSVQNRHVKDLPAVSQPREEGYFVVQDSIEGWAQALDVLVEAYFYRRVRPQFDFHAIRDKGSYLATTGARAPGPEPLKKMLAEVEARLKAAVGRKLRPIEVHDLICIISECVLAGGIRRAALISLFDRTDEEMLRCKTGDWWIKHPHRRRANNSAVMVRGEVTKEEFLYIYGICRDGRSGEPGFYWTNDPDMGANPCVEVSLWSEQFCNLSTVNQRGIRSKKDLIERVRAASFIGSLQAAYTDFPYLAGKWREVTEREALIGVSFTGIADSASFVTNEMLQTAAGHVLEVNAKISKKIGTNPAARSTVLKPEGSSSTVLKTSSGIHGRHAKYYLRSIRTEADDALTVYLRDVIPDLVEDEIGSSTGAVVIIPQMSPPGSILRSEESALALFDRAMDYNTYWIAPGHRTGPNRNNVSCTLSVRDEEWDALGERMWEQRHLYSGISLFPYDGGVYQQAPFQECDKETFERYSELVAEVDLRNVKEIEDMTTRTEQIACAGSACEIL